jgi:hypothetical protein
MSLSPSARYALATLAVIALGLLVRWPALGLPWPIAKYAGSALWGAMVYAGLRAVAPRAAISTSAAAACAVAVVVELSRLYHQPALDAFRVTLAGKLLLGNLFSPWNIVAYGVGIAASAWVDRGFGRRITRPDSPRSARSPE